MEQSFHHSVTHERSSAEVLASETDSIFPLGQGDITSAKSQQMFFVCELCPKHFASKLGLKNHNKMSHGSKEDCFVCDLCDKVFPTRTTLSRHKKAHSDLRPFVCSVCGKSYKHNIDLSIHMKAQNHEWKKIYDICSFV